MLGIFNLNFDTDEDELRRIYSKYGELDKVTIVMDRRVGDLE